MKLQTPLVSIVTPCYNGKKWINLMIDSVLNQTYPAIEFIIVNDGSTDESEDIILSYKEKFLEKGYDFKYIKQENKGLGGAIDTGIKEVTGEYLCWPDIDDYLELNSVQVKVDFLINNPEYAIVTSNAYVRQENNPENVHLLVSPEKAKLYSNNQFELLLNGKGVFCPGCHMMRVSVLDEVIPNRDIYPARRGQNWQLLLPVYYSYKGAFLNIPLYNYIDHPGSMSKDGNNSNSIVSRCSEHELIIINTLAKIEEVQNVNLAKEKEFVRLKYINAKLMAAKDYNDKELYIQEYNKKKKYGISINERLTYVRMRFKVISYFYKYIRKLK